MGPVSRIMIHLIIFLTGILIFPTGGRAVPRVAADAAVLVDASTGQVLYEKNGAKRRAPASLTKIITCIIALEYGHLGEVVTVSRKAGTTSIGSTIGLNRGDKITLGNLVEAALISSANDSTVAIAEHIGGSHEAFIHLMNKKAVALGAFNTRFKNTNGYSSPNHYSTARDLAVITRYALQNPTFNGLVKTKKATIAWYDPVKEKEVTNTNRLLVNQEYPGIDGVKTGTAVRAGKCLIASATRDGRRLIAVVLHSPSRYRDAVKLLDYGFTGTVPQVLCRKGQVLAEVPVSGGVQPTVHAVAKNEVSVYLDRENPPEIQKKFILSRLTAPVNKGDVIGKVIYATEQGELARGDLVAGESVRRPWWPVRIWRNIKDTKP